MIVKYCIENYAAYNIFQVALNKPSGLQVLPGGLFQQRTVLTQLQWRPEKPNSSRAAAQKSHPVPVHRLGRGTSGLSPFLYRLMN